MAVQVLPVVMATPQRLRSEKLRSSSCLCPDGLIKSLDALSRGVSGAGNTDAWLNFSIADSGEAMTNKGTSDLE